MDDFRADPLERYFVQETLREFAFLRETHEFEADLGRRFGVRWRKSYLEIDVSLDYMQVFVMLKPIAPAARLPARCCPAVPLGTNFLIECLDPTIEVVNTIPDDEPFDSKTHIPMYLRGFARLLNEHLRDFLEGQFERWPSIAALRRRVQMRLGVMPSDVASVVQEALNQSARHLVTD